MHFKGTNKITIQPNDSAVPYRFIFTTCSTELSNDGYLPYGTTIVGAECYVINSIGAEVLDIVDSVSFYNNTVTVSVSYPTTSADGDYKLTFRLSISNGSYIEADFGRVFVGNL